MIPPRVSRVFDDHYWTTRFLVVELVAVILAVCLGGPPR